MSLSNKARRHLEIGVADKSVGKEIADAIDAAASIQTSEIDDLAVTTPKIADAAVTTQKLGPLAQNNIWVGNGSNRPVAVGVQGDIKLASTGEAKVAIQIKNTNGFTLNPGTLVLYGVNSSDGSLGAFPADPTGTPASHVVREAILDGATGYIYESALITGLNTNAANVGDLVFLGTNGSFTFTSPNGVSDVSQVVGQVTIKNNANGAIFFYPAPVIGIKLPGNYIQDSTLAPVKLTSNARTKIYSTRITLPAPTGANQNNIDRYLFTAPVDGTQILSAKIISDTATAGSAPNDQYQFRLRNITSNVDIGAASTNTNGSELVAETPKSLDVSTNNVLSNGNVIALRTNLLDSVAAGPTDLSTANIRVEISYLI